MELFLLAKLYESGGVKRGLELSTEFGGGKPPAAAPKF